MMKPIFIVLIIFAISSGGYWWYTSSRSTETDMMKHHPNWVFPSEFGDDEMPRRPDFVLTDLDGNHRTNSEWDGKVVVINFWATWCPPCIKEIPMFIKVQKKYAERGLQLIGIAIDNLEAVQQFAKKMDMNYPVLIEEHKTIEIAKQFGNRIGALPFTVVIDRQGNMVLQTPGEMEQHTLEEIILPLL